MSSTISATGCRLFDSPGPPCARTSGTPAPRDAVQSDAPGAATVSVVRLPSPGAIR